MTIKRAVLRDAITLSARRPKADLSIEQYLMTAESLATQVLCLASLFQDKKILHLGDDDHLSVLFAKHLNSSPIVAEYDNRIRKSLSAKLTSHGIEEFQVFQYDARNPMPRDVKADAFYINPPYSSKNEGKGAKVWISRVASAVQKGSTSVLVYPIDETLPWTMSCLKSILDFAYKCGFVMTNIDRDVHTYEYLPKDPGLLSSNIYLYKFADITPPNIEDTDGESLYR